MISNEGVKERKEKRKTRQINQKDRILQAGEKIFARKGFHLATLEEIARDADLAKGTIYLHFLNKADLFVSVIEKKLNILLKKIKEVVREEGPPVEKIRKVTEIHLRFLEQNKNFFKILHSLPGEHKREMEKELTERVIKKNASYLGIIQKLIEEGIKRKEIKPLNPRKLAVILVGMVHSLTINWISCNEKYSLSEDHNLAWEVFWKGARLDSFNKR